MSTPRHDPVTVVIPTYNRSRLVERAVTSVLRAVSPGDEIIVVDDGSTDDTEAVLARFSDRIRYLRVPNGGPGKARNHGIRAARNPLVAFLDSDDEWLPDKLALQRTLMSLRPELVLTFSTFRVRDEAGEIPDGLWTHWLHDPRPWEEVLGEGTLFSSIAPLPEGRDDFLVYSGDLYVPLLEQMYVAASTAMVRRALAGESFRYAEDLRICEDWTCFAQVARHGPAAYLDCPLALNYGHEGPRLTTEQGQYGLLTARILITTRIWGTDSAFLDRYGARYHQVLSDLHQERAKWLISHGRTHEARADLELADHASRSLRVLSRFPGPVTVALGDARRTLLKLAGLVAGVLSDFPL